MLFRHARGHSLLAASTYGLFQEFLSAKRSVGMACYTGPMDRGYLRHGKSLEFGKLILAQEI